MALSVDEVRAALLNVQEKSVRAPAPPLPAQMVRRMEEFDVSTEPSSTSVIMGSLLFAMSAGIRVGTLNKIGAEPDLDAPPLAPRAK